MKERPHWKRPSALEIGMLTAVPIVGVLGLGWSGTQILLLFWIESAVAGGFNALRLALTKPVYENRADYLAAHPWLLQHYPISPEDWAKAGKLKVPSYPSMKPVLVPLFLGHYSFFLVIHAFLLATLVGELPAREWWTFFSAEWSGGMFWAVISVAAAQGWRFWAEDLQGRTYTRTCPFLGMVYPYRRLLVLQVALFLGGLAIVFFELPAALAVLLILVKAAFDLNWIRIPIGPRKIDWSEVAEREKMRRAGAIVGKTVEGKPDDCRTELTDLGRNLCFTLPARGIGNIWRKMRAGGCLLVGMILLGVVSFFGFAFVGEQWRVIMTGGSDHYWFMLLIMTVAQGVGTLWLLMFSMLLSVPWSVLAFGTRRGTIELTDGRLMIRQYGFPWGKSGEMAASEIVDLGMSPTGSKTNEFSVVELRIRLGDGSEHTYFAGRDADELNWIATRLTMRLAEL
jgi:hypothetical protein